MPASLLYAAVERRFGAAFEFRRIWPFIKDNIGNYLLAIVVYLIARFLGGIGIFFFCIGVIFTGFWAFTVHDICIRRGVPSRQGAMRRDTKILMAVLAPLPALLLAASTLTSWAVAHGASPRWRLLFRILCHGYEERCLVLFGVPDADLRPLHRHLPRFIGRSAGVPGRTVGEGTGHAMGRAGGGDRRWPSTA